MSKLVDISSDEFWQILFDEACVEGRQAERIETELNNVGVDENEIRNKVIDEVLEVINRTYHNFCGYDLEQMTKYGNESASQQHDSYSTIMMYEVADKFDDMLDDLADLKKG